MSPQLYFSTPQPPLTRLPSPQLFESDPPTPQPLPYLRPPSLHTPFPSPLKSAMQSSPHNRLKAVAWSRRHHCTPFINNLLNQTSYFDFH
ncbi:hypothetical protein Pcinc_041018 [Petrolisthes cinctipes]|uniref:Uncharacterized protein n=1 Tax=Petrolisthes cinctipes TaxID=88211 RepID=A0AAE1BKR1_PETCI|nr:hypothetical protein Pcinc_041018 [Petrolisthes cinctipes]